MITTIGLDADDTLWHNETIFEDVHQKYRALLARWHDAAAVDRALFATEMRNLELFGYGVKAFTLSAIETAIELTGGKISGEELRALLDHAKHMLAHPVELLEGVAEAVPALAATHRLIVITKGDLRDQERKIVKSGLAAHFHGVEIVSEKDPATYAEILRRHAVSPDRFLMAGNSLKSDILPVLDLGGHAVHVPYPLTWGHEHVEVAPMGHARFFQLRSFRELPALVARLSQLAAPPPLPRP